MFLEVLIEAAALVVGLSILLPFATVRWTWPFFSGWASAVMATGVRLMFMLMVLALGLVLANSWTQSMVANSGAITTNTFLAVEAMVESFFFALVAWRIPRKMASYVDNKISATLGESLNGPALQATGQALQAAGKRAAGAAAVAGKAAASGAANLSQTVGNMLLT
jgi:type IV secretory pathway TrbL component